MVDRIEPQIIEFPLSFVIFAFFAVNFYFKKAIQWWLRGKLGLRRR